MRGRDQPAKRAGSMQAADAAHHQAQRVLIRAHVPAHLASRQTLLVLVVADAESCASSLRTAVVTTINAASSMVLDMSDSLPNSTDEQSHIRHTLSSGV